MSWARLWLRDECNKPNSQKFHRYTYVFMFLPCDAIKVLFLKQCFEPSGHIGKTVNAWNSLKRQTFAQYDVICLSRVVNALTERPSRCILQYASALSVLRVQYLYRELGNFYIEGIEVMTQSTKSWLMTSRNAKWCTGIQLNSTVSNFILTGYRGYDGMTVWHKVRNPDSWHAGMRYNVLEYLVQYNNTDSLHLQHAASLEGTLHDCTVVLEYWSRCQVGGLEIGGTSRPIGRHPLSDIYCMVWLVSSKWKLWYQGTPRRHGTKS